jgi:hypothetical protein
MAEPCRDDVGRDARMCEVTARSISSRGVRLDLADASLPHQPVVHAAEPGWVIGQAQLVAENVAAVGVRLACGQLLCGLPRVECPERSHQRVIKRERPPAGIGLGHLLHDPAVHQRADDLDRDLPLRQANVPAPAQAAEEYIARVEEMIEPTARTAQPLTAAPLDLPYPVSYLDAVWKSKTSSHLFVNADPASAARLTQASGSEEEFNSLMSALADVLGQVVTPGTTVPPQRGALEQVRDYLVPLLDSAAADRVSKALGTLIRLRHIRVSAQHSDARPKAVTAFGEIGLPFPPVSWDRAWAHIAAMAGGALDAIREEVHAGLP